MSILIRPLLVEIASDQEMENLFKDLEVAGFMNRFGFEALVPYQPLVDAYYQENSTMPTHILLTDASFDPETDGLSVQICGVQEIEDAQGVLEEDIEEMEFDVLRQMVDDWVW